MLDQGHPPDDTKNCHIIETENATIFSVSPTLKMGEKCCLETSVINYHCLLRNDPEELSSQIQFWFCLTRI